MRESLQRCQKLAGTKRNALAGEIIEATECLKAWGEHPPGHGRARAGTGRRHPRTGAGWPPGADFKVLGGDIEWIYPNRHLRANSRLCWHF
jgi:hypothetical protein